MRASLYLVVAAVGCASVDKMSWPTSPAPAPQPRPQASATTPRVASNAGQGGPLTLEPPALPVHVLDPNDRPAALLFEWPVAARGITSLFGHRTDPLNGERRFHAGVDMNATYGEVIRASAPGTVAWASWYKGHGRHVVIEHAGGFRTSYSHLAQVLVREGDIVRQGQPIGQLGSSGRSTGPHLHFEVSRHGQVLDPLDLLGQVISVGDDAP